MKKNVWLMNHYATNMFADLGGRHYWFAENLQKNGYNPVIFCASTFHLSDKQVDLQGKKYIEKTTETGIKFVFVKAPQYKGNGFSRVKNMISFAWNLYFVAKNYAKKHENPDVILASSVHPLTIVTGIFLGRYFKVPCIGEVRDLWPEIIFMFGKANRNSMIGKFLVFGEHWIYRNVHAIIFTCEGYKDYLCERKWDIHSGGDIDLEKTFYINNGVDLISFDNNSVDYKTEDADLDSENIFKIIYAGSIRAANGLDILVDVAEILMRKARQVILLIYGDGEEKKNFETLCEEKNLTNIKFKGAINKQYVPFVLKRADLCILHYKDTRVELFKYGSSNNKLFEYLAASLPVLMTVHVNYNFIESEKCGVVSDTTSAESIAETIIRVSTLPREKLLAMGKNARRMAEKFDFRVHTEKLIEIIENNF